MVCSGTCTGSLFGVRSLQQRRHLVVGGAIIVHRLMPILEDSASRIVIVIQLSRELFFNSSHAQLSFHKEEEIRHLVVEQLWGIPQEPKVLQIDVIRCCFLKKLLHGLWRTFTLELKTSSFILITFNLFRLLFLFSFFSYSRSCQDNRCPFFSWHPIQITSVTLLAIFRCASIS